MRRGEASVVNRVTISDFLGKASKKNISRSASDTGDRVSRKFLSDVSENFANSQFKDSASDIILEPFGQSSSGRWSKNSRTTSPLDVIRSDNIDFEEENELTVPSSPRASEINEESYAVNSLATSATDISYSMNTKRTNLSKIPLPPSAASFYNGYSPHMEVVESCESIHRLNMYLKARKDDVNAGVPGRFLHAVLGQDTSDVGSIASTIMYSFYLNESPKSDQLCTIPVINMRRADLNSHTELKWLLDSCNIDQSFLIFIDEIDLSYYDLFGSLKLVLLNGDKLPDKQEVLKDALVEIFNSKKDCSCCTLIAEKFALTSPETLGGRGFSRLLLAGILLDTGNLSSSCCTDKDKYMATLLINGAGRYGCTGLYQILRYKMYDVSGLKVGEILRKDFKKWTRIELEKLRLLMIVSGYYDSQKNFKREILVSAESAELMKNLLHFFNSNASQLPLKDLHQPGLRDEMRAFGIGKVTSRRTIERLLEEFGGTAKR